MREHLRLTVLKMHQNLNNFLLRRFKHSVESLTVYVGV